MRNVKAATVLFVSILLAGLLSACAAKNEDAHAPVSRTVSETATDAGAEEVVGSEEDLSPEEKALIEALKSDSDVLAFSEDDETAISGDGANTLEELLMVEAERAPVIDGCSLIADTAVFNYFPNNFYIYFVKDSMSIDADHISFELLAVNNCGTDVTIECKFIHLDSHIVSTQIVDETGESPVIPAGEEMKLTLTSDPKKGLDDEIDYLHPTKISMGLYLFSELTGLKEYEINNIKIENIEMAMNGGNYVVTAGISFLEEDKASQDLSSNSYRDKMFWSGEDAFRKSQTKKVGQEGYGILNVPDRYKVYSRGWFFQLSNAYGEVKFGNAVRIEEIPEGERNFLTPFFMARYILRPELTELGVDVEEITKMEVDGCDAVQLRGRYMDGVVNKTIVLWTIKAPNGDIRVVRFRGYEEEVEALLKLAMETYEAG